MVCVFVFWLCYFSLSSSLFGMCLCPLISMKWLFQPCSSFFFICLFPSFLYCLLPYSSGSEKKEDWLYKSFQKRRSPRPLTQIQTLTLTLTLPNYNPYLYPLFMSCPYLFLSRYNPLKKNNPKNRLK